MEVSIFFICLIIVIILGCVTSYYNKREFYVKEGTIVLLSRNNTLSTNHVYSQPHVRYKKAGDEEVNEFPVEIKNNHHWVTVTTSDKVNLRIEIAYNMSYDLVHITETVNKYGLDRYRIHEKLHDMMDRVITYYMLQISRKEFYDYMQMEKHLSVLNDKINTYLLTKNLYIDIDLTDIKIVNFV